MSSGGIKPPLRWETSLRRPAPLRYNGQGRRPVQALRPPGRRSGDFRRDGSHCAWRLGDPELRPALPKNSRAEP